MTGNGALDVLEKSPLPRTRRLGRGWIAALVLAAGCLIFSQQILWELGAMLVDDGPPRKADIAVTLAGDASGDRILKAAELVRQGYVPKVLVSGTGTTYGVPQTTLEIEYAVRSGYPREYFVPLQHHELSTKGEAQRIAAELRMLGVHKYLVVTSYFHTARAARILRRTAPELEMHVVGAPVPHWNDGYWWKEREGQKIWIEEEAKTVADFFRL